MGSGEVIDRRLHLLSWLPSVIMLQKKKEINSHHTFMEYNSHDNYTNSLFALRCSAYVSRANHLEWVKAVLRLLAFILQSEYAEVLLG